MIRLFSNQRLRRTLAWLGTLTFLAGLFAWSLYRRPPLAAFPDYQVADTLHGSAAKSSKLQVGFAASDITPQVAAGTKTVWMAGFHNGRAATGVHDPLWARAWVVANEDHRIAFVSLDLIGLTYADTIRIRNTIARSLHLDYVAVCCTHNHEGPDSMGLWGRFPLVSGRDESYMDSVRQRAAEAVLRAARHLEPARMRIAQAASGGTEVRRASGDPPQAAVFRGWIRDDRPPYVIDDTITGIQFLRPDPDESAIGSVVIWGNHPEALGDTNTQLTSDYPHFLRERIEQRSGAPCVFLVGAIGGLMSPLDAEAKLPDGNTTRAMSYAQAQAIGYGVGDKILHAWTQPHAITVAQAALEVRASTITWPMTNQLFYAAARLGTLPRGVVGDNHIQSEVGVAKIGPLALMLVPGEIYPELVIGGVESLPGADYPDATEPGPALYRLSDAPFKAVIGLSNDLVGYIIPRAEWDDEPPYLNNSPMKWYGEINSTGPGAAVAIYDAFYDLLTDRD